jgi:nucleotide-binding universal stress UspA family protein
MATYQKILAALDKSHRSDEVFHHASTLACQHNSQLLLLHCLTWPPANQDFGDRYNANLGRFMNLAQQQIDERRDATRHWMEGYVHDAHAMGLDVDWDWRIGNPGSHLCEVAKTWDADLLVVGRRGHQGIKEVLIGSVSNYVMHRAPCSVLVVQGIP